MIEALSKLGIEEKPSQCDKSVYEKNTTNIIFSAEKWKAFPLRSKRQDKNAAFSTAYSTLY